MPPGFTWIVIWLGIIITAIFIVGLWDDFKKTSVFFKIVFVIMTLANVVVIFGNLLYMVVETINWAIKLAIKWLF
jgi:hypothetical protein